MVAHSRAPLGARPQRALNAPLPVRVWIDEQGVPVAVQRRPWPRPLQVQGIQDRWRIDDEWWRDRPIARLYYTLLLPYLPPLTLYHDRYADAWFEQRG